MRFAIQIGEPHPDFVWDRLSPRQLSDIVAYSDIEPLSERRADLRAGTIALVAAKSSGVKGAMLDHFVPDYDAEPLADQEEQTPGEMSRQMEKVAAIFAANERNEPPHGN